VGTGEWVVSGPNYQGFESEAGFLHDHRKGLVKGGEKWSEAGTDLLCRLREEKASLFNSDFVKWAMESVSFPGRTAETLIAKLVKSREPVERWSKEEKQLLCRLWEEKSWLGRDFIR
jgi:HD superfamily phosphodiesterase